MPVFYETHDFRVKASDHPHVSRTDGGHIIIHPKQGVVHRWQFDIPRATALMRLSMLVGEAMLVGLNERGIPVERLNYQDNGNWGIGTQSGPLFHLHIFGRAKNSINQVHGEALRIPARETEFWKHNEALNEEDIQAIVNHIHRLEKADRYQLERWNLIH